MRKCISFYRSVLLVLLLLLLIPALSASAQAPPEVRPVTECWDVSPSEWTGGWYWHRGLAHPDAVRARRGETFPSAVPITEDYPAPHDDDYGLADLNQHFRLEYEWFGWMPRWDWAYIYTMLGTPDLLPPGNVILWPDGTQQIAVYQVMTPEGWKWLVLWQDPTGQRYALAYDRNTHLCGAYRVLRD